MRFTIFRQIALILAFGLAGLSNLMAQKPKLISAGISANAYRGDLTNRFEKWTPVYHVGFKFNSERKLNGNLNLGAGYVTGNNAGYTFDNGELPAPAPNRFFRTSVFMLNYELNYNFFQWRNLTFFISQGIGLFRFNPQDEFSSDLQDQPQTRAPGESYSNITLQLPSQLGLLYRLPNGYTLGFQVAYVNPLTDYVDNISDWGTRDGFDQMLSTRFSFHVPVGGNASN